MTQEEIIKGNELIARYMGVDINFDPLQYRDSRSEIRHYTDHAPKPNGLEFHTNWNWIMPVIEKIETTTLEYFQQNVTFSEHTCCIFPHVPGLEYGICNSAQYKINAVWLTLVQYTEWFLESKYNTNDKSNSSN